MAKGMGGVYFRGQKQTLFNTVEFGISPFVPFSQAWNVRVETHKETEFHLAPEGQFRQVAPDADWQDKVDRYDDYYGEGGQSGPLEQQLEDAPGDDFEARAAALAKELGNILDGERTPLTQYETTEKAELEERLLMDWFFDTNHGWTQGQEPWRVANFDGRRRVAGKQIEIEGKEMLDMMATSEREAQYTEYVLHRLAFNFGDDWVRDVQGVEMTKMVGEKYLQQVFSSMPDITDPLTRLQLAGEAMARDIMGEYNQIGGTILEAARGLLGSPGHTGPEDIGYIAKQVLDRLAEITHRVGSTQASYIYQVPIVHRQWQPGDVLGEGVRGKIRGSNDMLVGFIKLTPVVRGGAGHPSNYTLTNIDVSARMKDLSDPPPGMSRAQWISSQEMKSILDQASNTAYGTFAQWLMWDAAANLFNSHTTLAQMSEVIGQGLGQWGNFTGKRNELLGSSLWSTVEGISRGMVDGLGDIRAVDVLTTQEISQGLEAQFRDFLDPDTNLGLTNALRQFYENAVTTSNEATDAWKSALTPSPINLGTDSIWRTSGLYDQGGKSGEGMGAPFFLFSGRDDSAFLKFKDRVKGGAKAWINLMQRPGLTTVAGTLNPEAFGLGRATAYTLGGAYGEIGMLSKVQGEKLTQKQVAEGFIPGGITSAGQIKGMGGYQSGPGAYETFYKEAGVPTAFDTIMEIADKE